MVLPKNELMEKIKTSNTIQNKTIFQTCQKRWDAVLNCLVTRGYTTLNKKPGYLDRVFM